MKKLERQREHAERMKRESIAAAQAAAGSIGQGFVDHELPPDEVDEKVVKRTILTSLRSMIPYTNEWYESRAAEEEMDNLKKIRIEQVKANDLFVMAKMGRHEEALEMMMKETNYDFFYFNKLKHKMEQEGKYKFEMPKEQELFGEGGHKNRIRKAANMVANMDLASAEELARMMNSGETKSQTTISENLCTWRGRTKKGEFLKCENRRIRRPLKTSHPMEKLDYYPFCSYHVVSCISANHEDGEDECRIITPNLDALCLQCYMMKHKRAPPNLTADICPGVAYVSLLTGTNASRVKPIMEEKEKLDLPKSKKKTGQSRAHLCSWAPNPNNEALRGYECCNELMIDPNTNHRLPFCPWHVSECVRPHPPNSNNTVSIPNQYGLCKMHYLAEYGVPPPVVEIPYPGMRKRLGKDFWKHMKKRHFGAPKNEPIPIFQLPDYFEPDPPDNFIDKAIFLYKFLKFYLRRRREGERRATQIQSTYRMYRVRNCHLPLRDKRYVKLRHEACIKIQTHMRRFLQSKYMQACRIRYNNASKQIQRIYRGWSCRKMLRREWAARRITKFMKLLHFFKFKDAVIMIMQLRRFFKKRNMLAMLIQRVYRGYSGRLHVFKIRLWRIMSRSYAKKLQRFWRHVLYLRSLIPYKYPGKDWMYKQCAKKLAHMILELYLDARRRRELQHKYAIAAPQVQRLIRGFLARSGKKKLSYLRKALQSWFEPQYAMDFMSEFLRNRVVDTYCLELINRRKPPVQIVENQNKGKMYIRNFLPENRRQGFEIDYRTFDQLIVQWYQSIHLPLVESEKSALIRTFKNPMNGNILIRQLDEYIHHHTQPCRKHGRRVCGSCYYYRHCMMKNCHCQEYCKNKHHKGGICSKCDHPRSLHAITPLQVKYPVAFSGDNMVPLLDLLSFQAQPDMSIPVNVTGVAVDAVLIRDLDEDDKRQIRRKVLQLTKKGKYNGSLQSLRGGSSSLASVSTMSSSASIGAHSQDEIVGDASIIHSTSKSASLGRVATKGEKRLLSKTLARLEMGGDTVYDNSVYWDQYSVSCVKPTVNSLNGSGNGPTTIDDSVFEKVTFDEHVPDVHGVTYEDFWKVAAKNPNKKVLDYNEKFDHNMPVPVIHQGEIVYSFDGSQIYYNIINQIIQMDEKDIHYDHPILLKLVMDHIQIFERHWRKMVVDIRLGKLDKHLLVSEEARLVFESSNVPRPVHADRLDETFRKLGFHKKVVGKDIEIKSYAPKKTKQEIQQTITMNAKAAEKELQGIVEAHHRAQSPVIKRKGESPPRSSQGNRNRSYSPPAKKAPIPFNEATINKLSTEIPELSIQVRIPTGGLKETIFKLDENEIKRKYSLPFEPSEASILSMSRPMSQITARPSSASNVGALTPLLSNPVSDSIMKQSDALIVRTPSARNVKTPDGKSRPSSVEIAGGTFTTPRRLGTAGRSKREQLSELGQTFFANKELLVKEVDRNNKGRLNATIIDALDARNQERVLSATRTPAGSVRRRKSQSQAEGANVADFVEVNQTNYELVAQPRDKKAYIDVIKLNQDRYVCPFPACGCSFYSKEAALRHMPIHEQRARLYSATPMSDSHLKFYWPTDVPWLKNKQYTEKTLPPGSVRCTVENCPEIFATQAKLEAHMRLIHQRVHPSTTTLAYFKCEKNFRAIPPDPGPEDFHLPWCHYHATPVGRCPLCVEIETNNGPKPPYYMHESISIDFQKKQEALAISISSSDMKSLKKANNNSGIVRLHQRDHKYVLIIHRDDRDEQSSSNKRAGSPSKPQKSDNPFGSGEYKARAIFIMVDRRKIAYVGVEPLYSMDDIICAGLPMPFRSDTSHGITNNKYELYPARMMTGVTADSISGQYKKMSPDNVIWTPIHTIRRVVPLIYIKNTQFVKSNAGNPLDNLVDNVDQVPVGAYFTRTEP